MSRVLVVANEAPWPVHNGGRARMSGLVQVLRARHEVVLVAADAGAREDGPVPVEVLPRSRTGRVASLLGRGPRLGSGLLDGSGARRVAELARQHRVDAVLATHSYLVPLLSALSAPLVLDLPNLEVARTASTVRGGAWEHRSVAAVEHLKARRWEPRAVRRADLCLAVDSADAEVLRGWGAAEVVVVPNASDAAPLPPSPVDGHVLAVADWRYAGNRAALPALLGQVWPEVRRARPSARLLLVGRGAPRELPAGAEAAGYVADLQDCYAGAAAVLAPATSGGGTQVKVSDAVARGRVVVCPPYGAASLPQRARAACVVTADLAGGVVRLLADVEDRHRRERLLRDAAPSWSQAAAPLLAWLDRPDGRGLSGA